jgi:hypothetical protein
VPHISLVFGEMWDSTALHLKALAMPVSSTIQVNVCVFPDFPYTALANMPTLIVADERSVLAEDAALDPLSPH